MDLLYAVGLIIVGLYILYITYKDERHRNKSLSVSYVMHLKGYLGGLAFVLIGIVWVLKIF